MSQITQFFTNNVPGGYVQTLTGNTGGAVGPTAGNINVVGDGSTITVAGNPGTSTLTISLSGTIADSFPTDAGTATPSGGVLNIFGGTAGRNINTTGSGDTVHVEMNNTITLGDLSPALIAIDCVTGAVFVEDGDVISNNIIARNGTMQANLFTDSPIAESTIFSATSAGTLLAPLAISIGDWAGAIEFLGNESNGSVSLATLGRITSILTATAPNYAADMTFSTQGFSSGDPVVRMTIADVGGVTLEIPDSGPSLTIAAFSEGVMQTNSSGVVTSTSGADGQIIIGSSSGAPAWANLTAGAGISISNGANSITISGSGTTNLTYTNVNTSPYVVLSTDEYISVDCSGGPITLQFPNAATSGRAYVVKDRTGSAATNNITVTTVGGAVNIDGATTFVMNTAYQSIQIIGNATTYEVF